MRRIGEALKNRFGERGQEAEIEAFVHGAMCVSISGRCFMSGFQTGKSANRGECTQPCRREYQVLDTRGEVAFHLEESHVMSPKDLCVLPFIEQLIEAGVTSFKIEGRNRSADYVQTVVQAYRECIDYYTTHKNEAGFSVAFAELKTSAMSRLRSVYNRDFSEGFYFGKPMGDWTTPSGNQATHRRVYVGKVVNYYAKPCVAEIKLEGDALETGDELFFEGEQTGMFEQRAESLQIDHQEITSAPKGVCVGLKTILPVRKNDVLYKRVIVS